MDWQDEGLLLAVRPHGESAAIIDVFTPSRGRHGGVVRGGASRRLAPVLQPGNQLALRWSARLEEHLGQFAAEPSASRSHLWNDRLTLAGLSSALALLTYALPERDPHPMLYAATQLLLDRLGNDTLWPLEYALWERQLLDEMGYGLDLGSCAVTGRSDDLAYLSPKTGRAISRAGAGDWADRLLPFPRVLAGHAADNASDVVAALAVTGHFLARQITDSHPDRQLPEARRRLVDLLAREATKVAR